MRFNYFKRKVMKFTNRWEKNECNKDFYFQDFKNKNVETTIPQIKKEGDRRKF